MSNEAIQGTLEFYAPLFIIGAIVIAAVLFLKRKNRKK